MLCVMFCHQRAAMRAFFTVSFKTVPRTRNKPFGITLKGPRKEEKQEERARAAGRPILSSFRISLPPPSFMSHSSVTVAAAASIYLSILPPAFGAKCYRAINGPSTSAYSQSHIHIPHSLSFPRSLSLLGPYMTSTLRGRGDHKESKGML